mmetsp:Transcript_2813/g.6055  ORF Transcript_2813/g.6055 Transcript_2813/m.6055 type:complete len:250 (+) Transcript_2813:100-849(+)|eukprot:CAMPEP_0119481858 /NCGR_PEP_ID=MMETSP1344-20130328/9992_1 /TAXON_ID=236787 /ORGANISM="Florenciella parvula, Strain CCMP2471" /LENGTH=249 /DNA_ID=CAMNT_0007516237 /DNA_START=89 /DNA_END=838 /DNA_ORIENTATION=-
MYAKLALAIACLSHCTAPTVATVGVDVSQAVSESVWECLETPGGQGAIEFAIPRVYKSGGSVDTTGVASIGTALSAGIKYVDGYVFPCVSCGNAAGQVSAAAAAVKGSGYGMLWYDIESYNWGSSTSSNQAFVEEMIKEGLKLGVTAGIYTNYYNWQSIVGLDYDYPSSLGLPLWYAHYDNLPSFSDYTAFGGWSSPSIKQYEGDKSSCGIGVDYNWYPSSFDEVREAATKKQRTAAMELFNMTDTVWD